MSNSEQIDNSIVNAKVESEENHGIKRSLSDDGHDLNSNENDPSNSNKKKAHIAEENEDEAVYLKFLVPQATAGSVIGKGGANISELQKEYAVHIRMSKANDVFPGTDSRVALMSGSVKNVLTATMIIFKRMTSPSDLFPKNPRPKSVSDREISLIVGQSTASLIIGKAGARVKSIQESSNCHVNLTPRSDQLPSNERVVTIRNNEISNVNNIEKALELILDIIKSDPSSASCLIINYNNVGGNRDRSGTGSSASRRGLDDGYHHQQHRDDYYDDGPHSRAHGRSWERAPSRPVLDVQRNEAESLPLPLSSAGTSLSAAGYPGHMHFWCTFSGPPIANGHIPPPHMLEGMKTYLLNVGYPLKAAQEIISASNILASYGVLKPGNISIFNSTQLQTPNPFNIVASGNSSLTGAGGGVKGIGTAEVGFNDGNWKNPADTGVPSSAPFMNKIQPYSGSVGLNRGNMDGMSFNSNYSGGGGFGKMMRWCT